jgi:NitT/TauT family transport system substrate-binding protein
MQRLLSIAFAIASLGLSAGAARSEPIVIGHTSAMLFLPSYVAVSKGYFKDEGLEAEIKFFRGGAQAMAAVISGDAHIYMGVPSTAMQAVGKGQAVKVYATTMNQLAMDVVVQGDLAKQKGVTASSPQAARIALLKGLTFGVNAGGGSPDQVLRFVLNNEKMDPEKDVTISPVGDNPSIIAAFGRKRIDAFFLAPPASDLAVDKFGGVRLFSFGKGEYDALNGIIYLGLISRADWIEADRERTTKIVKAIWRAEKLIKDNPKDAMESMRKYFSDLDQSAYESAFMSNRDAIPAQPRVEARGMELSRKFSEIATGEKLDVDVSKVYTNEFVERAAKAMQ